MHPQPVIDTDECTVEDIERDMGLVADVTGDYAAGRTHIHMTGEEFPKCLSLQELAERSGLLQ